VLLLRADEQDTAALVAGFARTVEGEQLVRSGWAHEIAAPREQLRSRVVVSVAEAGEHQHGARIPHEVHETIKTALRHGPVLVQAPRAGYLPSLVCERCRTPARCAACTGPLALRSTTTPPACRWCGTETPDWACPVCGHHGLRAPAPGEGRTAEELGRAFAPTPVLSSSGNAVKATVPGKPAIVVATPGAEPVAPAGYAAVVLLDTWLPLARADLRAEEEALRRWLNAAALVARGGRVVAVGVADQPALQALVRWDPAGFAEREATSRAEAHLPPASRLATISGDPGAVDDALTLLDRPPGLEVLGPVDVEAQSRVVVRVPRNQASVLSAALAQLQRIRSARKLDPVRIQVDPPTL
jgi:primosomal protein N' (replication factor Y)